MFTTKELNNLGRLRKQASRVTSKKPAPPPPVGPPPVDDPDYVPFGVKGIVGATEKLLAVNRGLDEPDQRDSYGFKRIYSVDRHLGERIRLDAGKVRRNIVRTAAKLKSLKGAYPFAFDAYSKGLILGDTNDANPLSAPLEEINPMNIMEQGNSPHQSWHP